MKKVMISFLAVFVVGSFSFAEVSDSSATDEVKAQLTKELNSAYQQQKGKVSTHKDLKYPLLQRSCADIYIGEEFKKNPNWKITRIKDNGMVNGQHSYTIISPSGWKTLRCEDDKYLNAFIELNKNPKDYKTYLAFLKASRDMRHDAIVYTVSLAGHNPESIEMFTSGCLKVKLNVYPNCSYTIRHLNVKDKAKEKTYLAYPYSYLKEYRNFRRYSEVFASAAVYMFPEVHKDGKNYVLFDALFGRRYDELFFTNIKFDPEDGYENLHKNVEKNKKVVPASAFKTLKTFNLNDYIAASSGVKCEEKIPDKIYKYIAMTENGKF